MRILHVVPESWKPRLGQFVGSTTMLVDEFVSGQTVDGHDVRVCSLEDRLGLESVDIIQTYEGEDTAALETRHPRVVYALQIPYGPLGQVTVFPTAYIRDKLLNPEPQRAGRAALLRSPLAALKSRLVRREPSRRPARSFVVPFGINPSRFRYSDTKGDRYLFLGTLSEKKGILNIIDAVQSEGLRLDICGLPHPPYGFLIEIAKRCNGDTALLGTVSTELKADLLAKARAVLIWCRDDLHLETFCLTQVEAALSGTPVVALGDVCQETTRSGETGFIVDSAEAFRAALHQVHSIHPERCHELGLKYSARAMVDRYYEIYEELLQWE